MTNEEVLNEFNNATSLVEIIAIGNNLKAAGVPITTVNRYASEARKKLLAKVKEVKKLSSHEINRNLNESYYSKIDYDVKHLNDPVIDVIPNGQSLVFIL